MTVTKLLAAATLGVLLLAPCTAFAQGEPVPSAPAAASAPAAPATAEAAPDKKAEARAHFDLGVSHFDREEWPAALAEFLISRQFLANKSNTKNAAICLRKTGRFAESLDMFETLQRDYGGELSPAERQLAERETAELRASVGTIDVLDAPDGSSVTIDGVDYGKIPLKTPVRLSAGNHAIRVVRDGFLPFEARVDLAGRQAAVVRAQLARLTQAGRLRVGEKSGKALDIVVDGSVVGRTPSWEGALAPGPHTVILRGDGKLGTQPVSVAVNVDEAAVLDLDAEELPAALSVRPTPADAIVAVDGVTLGHGPSGVVRLRSGVHKVDVHLEGFLAQSRDVTLAGDSNEALDIALESAAPKGRSGLQLELDGAAALGLVFGGSLSSDCNGACSASVPVGFAGRLHGSYRFASGWAVGLSAGYLRIARSLSERASSVKPVGRDALNGTLDDDLSISGLIVGPEGQFDTGGQWPITLRLGAGVFVGKATDTRTGTIVDSTKVSDAISIEQSPAVTFLYAAPEVRIGRRFGESFEINVGVELLFMQALKTPKWDDGKTVRAGPDGISTFLPTGQTLTGGTTISVLPGIGAKLQF